MLHREWTKFLEETGFDDIEKGNPEIHDSVVASLSSNQAFQSQIGFEAKQDYYQWARSKLNDGRFDSSKSELIWECHSEGMARREIAPRVGYEHSWISRKIKKIEGYLKAQSHGSGSSQLDLFFWSAPWEF